MHFFDKLLIIAGYHHSSLAKLACLWSIARDTLRGGSLLLRLGDLEKVRQALDDDVNVHVDEGHLVVGALVHDGD